MINSQLIMQYTNALYSTPPEFAPRYDEFRDMFSTGQIKSKEWLIKELCVIDPWQFNKKFVIAGAWFGTLGMMLKNKFPSVSVNMFDIDPRCEHYVQNVIYDTPGLKFTTADMYEYEYTEDVIVNTSCEHIPNLREWIDLIPKGKTVILQSNDAYHIDGHINCVSSYVELIEKSGITKISSLGELKMPTFTRYMIMGTT